MMHIYDVIEVAATIWPGQLNRNIMLVKYEGPTFSDDCAIELGSYDAGFCPDEYFLADGEISSIFVSPLTKDNNGVWVPAATPSDYTDRTTFGSIMEMRGFGTKALPEEQTYVFPGGDEFPINRTHTVQFTITDTKKANLDVIRQLQSGRPVAIWGFTKNDKHAFGGNDGVQAIPRNVGIVHESGDTPLSGQMSFVWSNLYDPVYDLGEEPTPAAFRIGKAKDPVELKTKSKAKADV